MYGFRQNKKLVRVYSVWNYPLCTDWDKLKSWFRWGSDWFSLVFSEMHRFRWNLDLFSLVSEKNYPIWDYVDRSILLKLNITQIDVLSIEHIQDQWYFWCAFSKLSFESKVRSAVIKCGFEILLFSFAHVKDIQIAIYMYIHVWKDLLFWIEQYSWHDLRVRKRVKLFCRMHFARTKDREPCWREGPGHCFVVRQRGFHCRCHYAIHRHSLQCYSGPV